MSVDIADFDYIRKLVYDHSAIVLEPGKEYLVEARLTPVARREGYGTIEKLTARLREHPFNGLHKKVIEAMTTNETSFFRDLHPFELLKKSIIPELMEKRATERKLSLWCAASSTGQEIYSIALLLREHFVSLSGWSVRLIASDISSDVLKRARDGIYSQLEINRGLPASLLVKYFQQEGIEWRIKDDIRKMVEFQQVNLANTWPPLPAIDIVMLRNVMIYFDVPMKKAILSKIRRILKPDGYLFLGSAETTINLDDSFDRVPVTQSQCYRLQKK